MVHGTVGIRGRGGAPWRAAPGGPYRGEARVRSDGAAVGSFVRTGLKAWCGTSGWFGNLCELGFVRLRCGTAFGDPARSGWEEPATPHLR
jgi:hypothetical protein